MNVTLKNGMRGFAFETYQDLLAIGENELGRMEFVLHAIQEHKYLMKTNKPS